MNDLIVIMDQAALTTSLAIAEGTENPHATVIKLARRYQGDLGEFGNFGFEIQKSTVGAGRPTEYALLNEPQATLLMTYMRNTEIVRKFKTRLIKAFYEMAEQLRKERTPPRKTEVQYSRGTRAPNGLDIRYTLDLTKLVLNPNQAGIDIIERLTGIDMSDISLFTPEQLTGGIEPDLTDWLARLHYNPAAKILLKSLHEDFVHHYKELHGKQCRHIPTSRQLAAQLRKLPSFKVLNRGGNIWVFGIEVGATF